MINISMMGPIEIETAIFHSFGDEIRVVSWIFLSCLKFHHDLIPSCELINWKISEVISKDIYMYMYLEFIKFCLKPA